MGGRRNPDVKPKPLLILLAASGALIAVLVTDAGKGGAGALNGPGGLILGLLVGLGAVALGVALAVTIGRRGKV